MTNTTQMCQVCEDSDASVKVLVGSTIMDVCADCARVGIADGACDAETSEAEAQGLIDRSISHDEIVHTEYDPDVRAMLMTASDDHVVAGDVTEFWGCAPDSDKMTWRVHMDNANA